MSITSPARGDAHNFGRCVVKRVEGDRVVFEKPRSCAWEHLFFGVDSPLRNWLQLVEGRMFPEGGGRRGAHPSLVEQFLQLRFESVDLRQSVAVEIREPSDVSHSPLSIATQFARLLAYALTFGLYDLHSDNVKLSRAGMVPVDVECVFAGVRLPQETLLVPTLRSNESMAASLRVPGFPRSWSSLPGRDFNSLQFLSDLCDALEAFMVSACDFPLRVVPDNVPMRVILRNTKTYRKILTGIALEPSEHRWPLLREEQIQLQRNDVPYFFTFPGKKDIFSYVDNCWRFEKTDIPADSFTHLSHRLRASVAGCLDAERLRNVFGSTLIFLSRRLIPPGQHEDPTGRLAVTRDERSIRVRYNDRVYTSRLTSPGGNGQ